MNRVTQDSDFITPCAFRPQLLSRKRNAFILTYAVHVEINPMLVKDSLIPVDAEKTRC